MKVKNIFAKIPKKLSKGKQKTRSFLTNSSSGKSQIKELFNKILQNKRIKIERIVSKNHFTKKGKWYNQNKNEWILIIKGNAELTFIENNSLKKIQMKKGDYINIPAHLNHRVDKTSKETIWLAVFY